MYGFKMNAMKPESFTNANITTVNPNEIISDCATVVSIDTKTATVEDLDFESDFKLNITRDGKVYAFCGWFDTIFDGEGIEKVMFSTSPSSKKTHWMQTLFVLREPINVKNGDVVQGHIKVNKMLSNLRQLSVTIDYRSQKETVSKTQNFFVT